MPFRLPSPACGPYLRSSSISPFRRIVRTDRRCSFPCIQGNLRSRPTLYICAVRVPSDSPLTANAGLMPLGGGCCLRASCEASHFQSSVERTENLTPHASKHSQGSRDPAKPAHHSRGRARFRRILSALPVGFAATLQTFASPWSGARAAMHPAAGVRASLIAPHRRCATRRAGASLGPATR
jgi:hypothetical protein